MRLQPRLNEDNWQFVNIREPSLGLDAFAGAVSDLLDEVAEDLDLSPKALELKHPLLAVMEGASCQLGRRRTLKLR